MTHSGIRFYNLLVELRAIEARIKLNAELDALALESK